MIHELGMFIHGVLFGLHSLGVVYNFKRKNYFQATIHLVAGGYDLWAVNQHLKEVRNGHGDSREPSWPSTVRSYGEGQGVYLRPRPVLP